MKEYKIGQRLEVKIHLIKSHGVFVHLPNSERGYIRRRNLDLNARIDLNEFSVGQRIEAEVVNLVGGYELSRRAILPDPWLNLNKYVSLGQVVRARVTDPTENGTYVEIVPGLTAFINPNDTISWTIDNLDPSELLFEDDLIEGIVSSIDLKAVDRNNSITINIAERLFQLSKTTDFLHAMQKYNNSFSNDALINNDDEQAPENFDEMVAFPKTKNNRIIIIDDEQIIGDELSEWLLYRGWTVEAFADPIEATQRLKTLDYDLILLDLNLGPNDGLQVLSNLRASHIELPVLLMSIPPAIAAQLNNLQKYNVSATLIKPFSLMDLDKTIYECLVNPQKLPNLAQFQEQDTDKLQINFELAQSDQLPSIRIYQRLKELKNVLNASHLVVFERDQIKNRIKPTYFVGDLSTNEAVTDLKYTPINNVLTDKQVIAITNVTESDDLKHQVQPIQSILQFGACIGVPITVYGEVNHALFAFYKFPKNFLTIENLLMTTASESLGTILEAENIIRRTRQLSAVITKGELAERLLHEVRNGLAGIQLGIENVIKNTDIEPIQRIVKIHQELVNLNNAVNVFQNSEDGLSITKVDLKDVVKQAIQLVQYIANKDNIIIRTYLDVEFSTRITTSPIAIQQSIINITLNAIQHIKAIKIVDDLREGVIELGMQKFDAYYIIWIRDNGPGIHKSLWKKVFEPGFSTRPDGSGLGLNIARSFVQSVGGTVTIESSVMFVGTTFTIHVPVGI